MPYNKLVIRRACARRYSYSMTTVTPGSQDTAVTASVLSGRPQRRGFAPLISPPRVTALDAARGLAVLGMISAHVLYVDAFEWGKISTWADLSNGRSSILFAVIAGVSLALMTGGAHAVTGEGMRSARLRLLGRGAAVFGLGLFLELLNTGIAVTTVCCSSWRFLSSGCAAAPWEY